MQNNGLCHVEWHVSDLERASRFFGALFGWSFTSHSDDYLMFRSPDGIGGAFAKVDQVQPSASPTVYVLVDDIDRYLARVPELGGSVSLSKTEIPNTGWMAILHDPDGNFIGLFTPRS